MTREVGQLHEVIRLLRAEQERSQQTIVRLESDLHQLGLTCELAQSRGDEKEQQLLKLSLSLQELQNLSQSQQSQLKLQ